MTVATSSLSSTSSSSTSADSRPLTVTPVRDKRSLDTFIHLPGRLMRDDPSWVEPLSFERHQVLSSKNPLFEHMQWQGFLAWRGDEPVGRISAQVDQLHRDYHGSDTGLFGMIDAIDDPEVFAALFAHAEDWLRSRGARCISGPFNLSINEECGLLVDGFDTPPSMMMGHAPPWAGPRVEACGYTPVRDLLAYWMRVADLRFTPAMQRMIEQVRARIRIRSLDRKRFNEDVMQIREVFNDAWANNFGFVPFTEAEFREMGTNLKLLVPPELIRIAEVDGEAVAFIIGFPNLNELIDGLGGRLLPTGWAKLLWRLKVRGTRTGRVPLMGVRQRYQYSRLGPGMALALIESIQQSFLDKGIEEIEMSWILEDNKGMRNILEHIGTRCYKRYRLYEKTLDAGGEANA